MTAATYTNGTHSHKLSPAMTRMLHTLKDAPLDGATYHRNRTVKALQRRGLVEYVYERYEGPEQAGCAEYRITHAGKDALVAQSTVGEILNSPEMVEKIKRQVREFVAAERDAEIAALVGEIRQTVDEMEALENKTLAAKDRLRVLLAQRGENWTDESGYARLMPDTVRTGYDTKALDALILSDPAKFARLRDYRREFTVRSHVQVK